MLNRQLTLSIVVILLVPNLVWANQIDPSVDLAIEKMLDRTSSSSSIPATSKRYGDPVQLMAKHGSNERRNRPNRRGHKTTSAPVRNSTTGTTTIRKSIEADPATTGTKPQQSVQCSAEGGSTVTQPSTTPANSSKVSSQTRTNCN